MRSVPLQMESREIGVPDLVGLIRGGSKLILGAALAAGALTLLYSGFLVPASFTATATLVISQSALVDEEAEPASPAYQALLESDGVLQETRERLTAAGVLEAGEPLRLGRELRSEVIVEGRGRTASFARVLTVVAVADDAEKASQIANSWAEVFVQQSRALGPGGSPAAETLLDEYLIPARQRIETLESERGATLKDYDARAEAVLVKWDSRIQALKKEIDAELAAFRSGTRREMEAVLAAHEEWLDARAAGHEGPDIVRRKALELVSVRAQLAQASRPWQRPSSVRSADLSDAEGDFRPMDSLLGLDINPLQDQLTLRALDLEGELKALVGEDLGSITTIISGIESVQFQREAGLGNLIQSQDVKLAELERRKALERAELLLQRDAAEAAFQRRLDQLTNLEGQLAQKHTTSVVEQVLGAMETVQLAARAVPPELADSRRLPLKVSLGALLGALLGVLVAVLR